MLSVLIGLLISQLEGHDRVRPRLVLLEFHLPPFIHRFITRKRQKPESYRIVEY